MFIIFVFFDFSKVPESRLIWNFMPPSAVTPTDQVNTVTKNQFAFNQSPQPGNDEI